MKKYTASIILAAVMMPLSSCGSTSDETRDVRDDGRTDLIGRSVEELSGLANVNSFPDLQSLENYFGQKASLVLDAGSFRKYEIRGSENAWFLVVRVLVWADADRSKPRTIEVQPRTPCIPEGKIAPSWSRRAFIPSTKSPDTRDANRGWVRTDIPHLKEATAWTYNPSPGRTISYWLRGVGQDACASAFSFSFS